MHGGFLGTPLPHIAACLIVAANDFLTGRLSAGGIVYDAIAGHVYAHIGRRVIGAFACNFFKDCIDDGEYLYITVIVYSGHTIGFQMEGVNHIDVIEVGGCGLIRQIDRVLERQIPNGKGFKFCVACTYAALIFMIELGEADRHFARPGTRSGNDNERARGLDILILSIPVIGHNERHIAGISGNGIMGIDLHAEGNQTAR